MGMSRLAAATAACAIAFPLVLTDATAVTAHAATTAAAGQTCTSSWKPTPAMPTVGATASALQGVVTISPTEAWAVGNVQNSTSATTPLIEHWTGSGWALVPSAVGSVGALYAVSASSASDVWAVGNVGTGSGALDAEHWDGTSWSAVAVPAPPASALNGVVDIAPDNVWAVGDTALTSSYAPLIEHWNGTAWSAVAAPAGAGFISAVAADSASDVWAVAGANVLHYTGTVWTSTTLTAPNGNPAFDAVAAGGPSDVWVAGGQANPTSSWGQFGAPTELLEHWNGSSWGVVPVPNVGVQSTLAGVTELPDHTVVAVGFYDVPLRSRLIVHTDGTTVTQETPGVYGRLYAASAASDGSAQAVGQLEPNAGIGLQSPLGGPPWTALAARRVSASWTDNGVPSPTDPATLDAVASTGTTALAAGWDLSGDYLGFSDQWSGSSWAQPSYLGSVGASFPHGTITSVAADGGGDYWEAVQAGPGASSPGVVGYGSNVTGQPATGPSGSNLYGLSLDSPTDGWAVGDTGGTAPTPLFLQRTSSGWTTFSSTLPQPPGTLTSVDAVSPTLAWGVGETTLQGSPLPLIEEWTGAAWSLVPNLPGPAGASGVLKSVSAGSATDAWAVGYSGSSVATGAPLIEHYNGAAWAQATPASAVTSGVLTGVLARSATDVYAVGYAAGSGSTTTPLIEHWDGSTWTTMDTSALPASGALNAISVVGDGLWAVGAQFDSNGTPSPLVASLCYTPSPGTPESPSTVALLLAGLALPIGAAVARRRRRASS